MRRRGSERVQTSTSAPARGRGRGTILAGHRVFGRCAAENRPGLDVTRDGSDPHRPATLPDDRMGGDLCFQIGNKTNPTHKHTSQIMLPEIFKTKERIRILRHISLRRSATVGAVALATGASRGFVSRYLNLLVDEKLLRRENRAFLRDDSAMWQSIKLLLNLDLLKGHIIRPEWARGIGIYGSWARGTNTTESDLDLWIFVDTAGPETEIRAAELEQIIAQYTHCEVNVLILTPDRVRHLRDHDRPFYTGLKTGYLTMDGEAFATT